MNDGCIYNAIDFLGNWNSVRMSTKNRHVVDLIEDGDGLILPFPEGMCEELGWEIGDALEFIDNKDGTWTMRKKEVDNGSTL